MTAGDRSVSIAAKRGAERARSRPGNGAGTLARGAGLAGAALAGAGVARLAEHTAPALAAIGPVRRRALPALSGAGDPWHVALTFDDGPDPVSTPHFLDMLDRHKTRATFFVLGVQLARYPSIGREIVAAGHEIAVHGWVHRCLLRYRSAEVRRQLSDAALLVEDITGQKPAWFRPPFGVLSAGAVAGARHAGMRPVLWTCWGKDWTATATPDSVHALVTRGLRAGGTILLHDTASPTAAPGSWRSTLDAAPRIIEHCRERGLTVGPVRDHGLPAA